MELTHIKSYPTCVRLGLVSHIINPSWGTLGYSRTGQGIVSRGRHERPSMRWFGHPDVVQWSTPCGQWSSGTSQFPRSNLCKYSSAGFAVQSSSQLDITILVRLPTWLKMGFRLYRPAADGPIWRVDQLIWMLLATCHAWTQMYGQQTRMLSFWLPNCRLAWTNHRWGHFQPWSNPFMW